MRRSGLAYRVGVIWRRRSLVLGVVIFSALTAAMTMAFRHGVYQTQAVLTYATDVSLLTDMLPTGELYRSVLTDLKLMEQAEYNPELVNNSSVLARYVQVVRRMSARGESGRRLEADAFAHLLTRLRARVSEDGRMVIVTAEAEEPILSPKLANQFAAEYQKRLMPLTAVTFNKASATWIEMRESVWPRAAAGAGVGLLIGLMVALQVEKIKRGMQNDTNAHISMA